MTLSNTCPCGSTQIYSQCCEPYHKGKSKPKTAEALLRARYSAFAKHEIDYIIHTHHSETVHEIKRPEIESWAKESEWEELKILQKEAGEESDSKGTIIFQAYYTAQGKKQEHLEKSFFEKEKGEWKFKDAQGIQTGPYIRAEPKIGRNDPCGCGSGKKSKKCCAA